ncbi:MAG: arginine--tRNA ligase [Candidatus Cloacimonadota bacterium]|nr:MAG: arginine--tRNA ligase [Candidatus Cloacimonadota bacterium]
MLKDKIYKDIKSGLRQLRLRINKNYTVEIPNVAEHGDFSTNAAMLNAKANNMNPRELAEKLVEILAKSKSYKSVEVAGPGFINFKLSKSVYHKALAEIVKAKKTFGSSDYGKGKKILLEYISANPTGPLNVVSARAGAYGDSLHRIMAFVGFDPFSEFYVNDAGNQVDILAESLEIRYRELHGDPLEEFPTEAYHGEYIKDLAVMLNSVDGSKLFHIAEKDRLERMKDFALEEIHKMQVESLNRFDVNFDNWMSEKKLRLEGILEEALSYLAEAHCTYEKDDAVWFSSSQFGDEKDRVLIKTDGNPTYLVPDIAYHLTKYQRGFDVMIDVLGPDHHGHVAKLKAALIALEMEVDRLEVVYLQHINLLDNGEIIKMSKRTGKIITMDDLIDEVGKDAARYFFLNRRPSAHLDFDMELAKKKSSENPVYYCQYAHARIHSILKKAKKEKISLKDYDIKNLKKLDKPIELDIIKKMLELPSLLNACADHREPHRLAGYVHELAGMFHKYYAKYKIVDADHKELSQSRMYLISAVKNVIAISLDLMGISAPEKM